MLRGKARYNIGEVAKISGLSIKTLRYYDSRGVLIPAKRDENTNYRYYSEDQLLVALAIREMKLRGFPLEEIEMLISSHSLDIISDKLNRKMDSIKEEIRQLEKQLLLVDNSRHMILKAMSEVNQNGGKAQSNQERKRKISVSYFDKATCVYTRYRSRLYVQEIFWDRFAEIYKLLDDRGYMVNGSIMAVFHEHYTHQFFFEEGDLEVLQRVSEADPDDPNVKEFGGFQVCSVTYEGFYANMLPEYVALIKWINENNYDIVGDPIEEYLVEFTQGVSRDEYVTRICFPVKKRERC